MSRIKSFIKSIIGKKNLQSIRDTRIKALLFKNFLSDYRLYKKHSTLLGLDCYNKTECAITLRYHSIEKGFLHEPIRSGFAKQKIIELIELLKKKEVVENYDKLQIQSALNSLCKYFEIHQSQGYDTSSFFSEKDYLSFKSHLKEDLGKVKQHTRESYFKGVENNFKDFAVSRGSVREFTGEKISKETLEKVVELANTAPSVCNRQGTSVHIIGNKDLIDQILHIQGGLTGYSEHLSQLLVLTCNRNYFYSIGERNQLYSEQIISLVAIGIPPDKFPTTLSPRRSYLENLHFID